MANTLPTATSQAFPRSSAMILTLTSTGAILPPHRTFLQIIFQYAGAASYRCLLAPTAFTPSPTTACASMWTTCSSSTIGGTAVCAKISVSATSLAARTSSAWNITRASAWRRLPFGGNPSPRSPIGAANISTTPFWRAHPSSSATILQLILIGVRAVRRKVCPQTTIPCVGRAF